MSDTPTPQPGIPEPTGDRPSRPAASSTDRRSGVDRRATPRTPAPEATASAAEPSPTATPLATPTSSPSASEPDSPTAPEGEISLMWVLAAVAGLVILIAGIVLIVGRGGASGPDAMGEPNPDATSVHDVYATPAPIVPVTAEQFRVVELSPTCAEAVAPVRALEDTLPKGDRITADMLTTVNETLSTASSTSVCSYEEYVAWTNEELRPWMIAHPIAAPEKSGAGNPNEGKPAGKQGKKNRGR